MLHKPCFVCEGELQKFVVLGPFNVDSVGHYYI